MSKTYSTNQFDPTSHHLIEDQKSRLKELFPEAFTEQAIDFDRLKTLLGETVEVGAERYSFTWPGKTEAIRAAQATSMGTLVPDKASSVDWDTTQNLYLEGDNLEILKLLQKSYTGKVKIIYIDPPYNTGKDFVYPDKYGEGLKTYLEYTGQIDGEGKKITTNTETDGRFHSKWLSMMYPRLMLARNLLKDDGVIFVSIDDHEVANLRKIMDEVFGGENFVTEFIWEKKKKPSFLDNNVGKLTEYILCYLRNHVTTFPFSVETTTEGKKYPLNNAGNSLSTLVFPPKSVRFNLPDGLIKQQDMSEGAIKTKLLLDLIIENGTNKNEMVLEGEWRYAQETLNEIIDDGDEISISKIPFRPNHIKSGGEIKKMKNCLTPVHYEMETNEDATAQIVNMFGSDIFDNPKPVKLIQTLIKAVTYMDKGGIVLDFFSGSGTAAHAAMALNAEDGGNRHFILSQLQEPTPEDSEARRARYTNIAEIGKERIRRAGVKIKTDFAETIASRTVPLDAGFKTYRLAPSTFNVWDVKPGDDLRAKLELSTSLIRSGAKKEDVLTELIIKSGYSLTDKIEELTIEGKKIYSVADGSLFLSLENGLSLPVVRAIAARTPTPIRFIAFEKGFVSDDMLTNTAQIMKDKNIEFRVL